MTVALAPPDEFMSTVFSASLAAVPQPTEPSSKYQAPLGREAQCPDRGTLFWPRFSSKCPAEAYLLLRNLLATSPSLPAWNLTRPGPTLPVA